MRKNGSIAEKISMGLNKIIHYAGRICKLAIPIVMAAICEQTSKSILNDIQYTGVLDYGDAVRAISESDMFSPDKAMSIFSMRENKSVAYYKAIAAIARNSSMLSHDKCRAIISIS